MWRSIYPTSNRKTSWRNNRDTVSFSNNSRFLFSRNREFVRINQVIKFRPNLLSKPLTQLAPAVGAEFRVHRVGIPAYDAGFDRGRQRRHGSRLLLLFTRRQRWDRHHLLDGFGLFGGDREGRHHRGFDGRCGWLFPLRQRWQFHRRGFCFWQWWSFHFLCWYSRRGSRCLPPSCRVTMRRSSAGGAISAWPPRPATGPISSTPRARQGVWHPPMRRYWPSSAELL